MEKLLNLLCKTGHIVSIIIVDKSKHRIIEFTAPLNGLLHIAGAGDEAVGGVGIGGCDVASGSVEFADVLGEIPPVCMLGAVNLNGRRACGDGLGGIPGDEPKIRVMATGEVKQAICR